MEVEAVGAEDRLAQAIKAFGEKFSLTETDRVAVRHVVSGLSCKESAALLKITADTVRQRRKGIYKWVGVGSAGRLTALVLEIPRVD